MAQSREFERIRSSRELDRVEIETIVREMAQRGVDCAMAAMGLSDLAVCTSRAELLGDDGSFIATPYIVGINRSHAPQHVLDALKALDKAIDEWGRQV